MCVKPIYSKKVKSYIQLVTYYLLLIILLPLLSFILILNGPIVFKGLTKNDYKTNIRLYFIFILDISELLTWFIYTPHSATNINSKKV